MNPRADHQFAEHYGYRLVSTPFWTCLRGRWSRCCILLSFLLSLFWSSAQAAQDGVKVQVDDPYIELHTDAGEGYPIFYVVERHDWVIILDRKTDWFQVRTSTGKTGWVVIDQMKHTLTAPGVSAKFANLNFDDYTNRTYEMGVLLGDFEGAKLMTFYASYHFMANLEIEASVSQATGDYTNQLITSLSMVSTPFPSWKLSPFFSIGMGHLKNTPRSTLASGGDNSDNFASAGFGLRYYLSRRFMVRAEAKQNVVFINDENNGEFVEWKAGFSFFF